MTLDAYVRKYPNFAVNYVPANIIVAMSECFPDIVPPDVASLVPPYATKNMRFENGKFCSFKSTPYRALEACFNLPIAFDWDSDQINTPACADIHLDLGGLI